MIEERQELKDPEERVCDHFLQGPGRTPRGYEGWGGLLTANAVVLVLPAAPRAQATAR